MNLLLKFLICELNTLDGVKDSATSNHELLNKSFKKENKAKPNVLQQILLKNSIQKKVGHKVFQKYNILRIK